MVIAVVPVVVEGIPYYETMKGSSTTSSSMMSNMILHSIVGIPLFTLLYYCCIEAYKIRLYALEEYGLIIHEFDPYFNYRATEVKLYILFVTFFDFYTIF